MSDKIKVMNRKIKPPFVLPVKMNVKIKVILKRFIFAIFVSRIVPSKINRSVLKDTSV